MDQIVSLETAKLALDVGFNENITHLYIYGENHLVPRALMYSPSPDRALINYIETPPEELSEGDIPAPTQTALSRWLREKHDMYVSVDMMAFKRGWIVYIISISRKVVCFKAKDFDTYEEALEEGLKQACKIVKERREND